VIIHHNQLKIDEIIKNYSEKDGVPIKYVMSTAYNSSPYIVDIFYRDTPHPEFGNKYFGLYVHDFKGTMITDSTWIEGTVIDCVEDDDGNYQYSNQRHDYKKFENGNMIDGGRAYTRSNGSITRFKVTEGELHEI
jgi:hypothetical protein